MTEQNPDESQEDTVDFNAILMPHIEENIPIPKSAYEALPPMNNEDEVMLRAQTYKELTDITGEEIAPNAENMEQAEKIAREMVENPSKKQDLVSYPNETLAFLAGMVGSMNHMIVSDLAELKLYVVNRLVEIVEKTDNIKEKTVALRAIGEVDGVDAFKKRVETTAKVESMEEVEKELLSMLNDFKKQGLLKGPAQTIEADYTISKKEIDDLQTEVQEYVGKYKVDGSGE